MLFSIRSIFAEQYRTDLADKTRRGLAGRARGGAPTGAVAYGYRIVTGANGTKTIEVDPERAAIIRCIFAAYAASQSFATIASELNEKGVSPPRPHSRRTGIGWMATAVRAMLLNARYVGRWTYGEREWVKAVGSNARRPEERRGGPLVAAERPELAIVDLALWTAVQARFDARAPQPAKKARAYLLSGIARCARCGGSFSCVGGGAPRRRFGCYNAYKRGISICSNRQTVLIAALDEAVLATLQSRLRECMDEVRSIVEEELKAFAASRPNRRAEVAKELGDTERKMRNLVNVIADTGSRELAGRLRELETCRDALSHELAQLEQSAVPSLPSHDEIAQRVESLVDLRDVDLEVARHQLQKVFQGARIDCEPAEDGSYHARWNLLPTVLLTGNAKTPTAGSATAGESLALVAGAGFEPTTFGL